MIPIRAFIAIELDDRVKRELGLMQKRLAKTNPDITWVAAKAMHLTLKFLGDMSPAHLEAVETAMDRTAAAFAPFHINIGELGAFPSKKDPKILWAGITKRVSVLNDMAEHLKQGLEGLPVQQADQGFMAHITLGRLKGSAGVSPLPSLLDTLTLPSGISQKVTGITLFRSELLPKGPVYHLLHNAPLTFTA